MCEPSLFQIHMFFPERNAVVKAFAVDFAILRCQNGTMKMFSFFFFYCCACGSKMGPPGPNLGPCLTSFFVFASGRVEEAQFFGGNWLTRFDC